MTQYPDLFGALAAPFASEEVRTRTQGNRQLAYITARVAMNRLDSVLGPENWWDDYIPGEKSVLCRLTVRLPDGSLLTKADAGGYAGMPDAGDDEKSGFSDAFKRAAVKFGVGRYLYRDGVPSYARQAAPRAPSGPALAPGTSEADMTTWTGRKLYGFVKRVDEKEDRGVLDHLNRKYKDQFGGRMIDWSPVQAATAHVEAMRYLQRARAKSG